MHSEPYPKFQRFQPSAATGIERLIAGPYDAGTVAASGEGVVAQDGAAQAPALAVDILGGR